MADTEKIMAEIQGHFGHLYEGTIEEVGNEEMYLGWTGDQWKTRSPDREKFNISTG